MILKMEIKKKKTPIALPRMSGSTTLESIPMAGWPQQVESKYSMKTPLILT